MPDEFSGNSIAVSRIFILPLYQEVNQDFGKYNPLICNRFSPMALKG
jgi:hypothetical protein